MNLASAGGGGGGGRSGGKGFHIEHDEHGRPYEMRAVITRNMLDEGTHARNSIIPPGYQSGKGQARGHMLARQLGGAGDIDDNLFTISQNPTNTPEMSVFEQRVYDAVYDHDVVHYNVYLEYADDDPDSPPAVIQVEAFGTKKDRHGNLLFDEGTFFDDPAHLEPRPRRRPRPPREPMISLAALTALCPPPAVVPPAPDWPRVEDTLGMGLPQDYKELITTYGPGRFCGFITLYQPHAPSEWADLTGPMPARLRGQIEEVRQAARHPWQLPHSPEDLFAVGVTGNGDYLFWVTRPVGTPDEWTVAVNEALRAPWFTYNGSLTEFLVSVLSGTTSVPMFPKDLLDLAPAFTPSPLESGSPAAVARTPASTRVIRDWASAKGYDLPERGRIPIEIIEAWKQENPN